MPANVSLPFFKPGQDVTVRAAQPLTGRTFVKAAPGGRGTLPDAVPAAAGDSVLGVAGHDIAAEGHVHVNVAGVVEVTLGADVTAGQNISVGSNGQAVPATEADGETPASTVVGYAVANGSSGAAGAILLK